MQVFPAATAIRRSAAASNNAETLPGWIVQKLATQVVPLASSRSR